MTPTNRDPEFLARVERDWWTLMQGELMIDPSGVDEADPMYDGALADLAEGLRVYARENMIATGAVQQDANGNEVAEVSEAELANRVTHALALVLYGGPRGGTPAADREATPRPRTILVHLNVEVPAGDERGPDEIADAILAAIEVGSDDDRVRLLGVGGLASGNGGPITVPLAEEV